MPTRWRGILINGLCPLTERLWALVFAAAGRLPRPEPERWRAIGGGKILVVSPHPDDETLGCGGVLLAHRRGNDRVVVVQVTDGRASRAGGLTPDEMAARRAGEALAAADRLGVELVALALSEGNWAEAALADRLRDEIAALDPDVVYAPSPVDYHPEHLKVARALAAALARPDRPVVRVWELGVPLTATLTNLIAQVGQVEPERRAALAAYTTQVDSLRSLARLRRYNRTFWQEGGDVECFWQLTPGQYRAVVAAAGWSGRTSPFRGFRPRPLGDPLSYLLGQAERRRLARVAARAAQSTQEDWY